jgi:signal transduction histidine kinase
MVRIEIENTGAPIDAAILDKIFEPFFTTKETGTGLGLSIAHQIIANHGGRLWISNVAEGVRVTIELPAWEENTGTPDETRPDSAEVKQEQ